FATDTFASLLSESRKYGLGMHLTNQYLAQLPEPIRDAVLGNVGTIVSFEVSAEDAKVLAKEFTPLLEADFMGLPRFNFYIKLMIEGKTSEAFSGVTFPPESSLPARAHAKIATLNRLAYGSPRLLVEEHIMRQLR